MATPAPSLPGPHFVFVVDGERRSISIDGHEHATIGRADDRTIALPWDSSISRLHAVLECLGGTWTVSDDGLSRNGTFLNGGRLQGRRRLHDGDRLSVGDVTLTFRNPRERRDSTVVTGRTVPQRISPAQHAVLVALCRPYKDKPAFATPATNQQIAQELFLSVDAVKTHLRALSVRFGVEDLPQNQKRVRLVERAFASGVIGDRDL
jgi:pSer/pThr/pTyr-binding forkhead associated (FHA) protein